MPLPLVDDGFLIQYGEHTLGAVIGTVAVDVHDNARKALSLTEGHLHPFAKFRCFDQFLRHLVGVQIVQRHG